MLNQSSMALLRFEKKMDQAFSFFRRLDKYIIHRNNSRKKMWDGFILVMVVLNAIFLPMRYSFEFDKTIFGLVWYKILVNLQDLSFLVDIGLTLLTSFKNRQGSEVMRGEFIAKNYMVSWKFVFDVLSVLGSDCLSYRSLGFFRFFKLI